RMSSRPPYGRSRAQVLGTHRTAGAAPCAPVLDGPTHPVELEDAPLKVVLEPERRGVEAAATEAREELQRLAHGLARDDSVEVDDLGFSFLPLKVGAWPAAGLGVELFLREVARTPEAKTTRDENVDVAPDRDARFVSGRRSWTNADAD